MTDGFGKVFAQLYEGSMVGAGPMVFALWPYCLARADAKGTVEVNPRLACHVIGCSVQQIEEALEYLQRPDPESRSREEDGRRLVREGQFAYRIVNYLHYRELRDAEARREYQRRWDRENRPGRPERRESKPDDSRPVPTDPDESRTIPTIPTKAEAEAEAEAEEERERGPSAPRPAKAGPSSEDVAQLAVVWNLNRGPLPGVSKIDPKGSRFRHARARLSETPDLDRWEKAVQRLAASLFATGTNDRGWRADFDFLLQPDALAKIEEGKYDDRKKVAKPVPGPGAHPTSPVDTPVAASALPPPPPTPDGPENVLPAILAEVRGGVDERDFATWLAPLRQAGPVNGHLAIVAPTLDWARQVSADYSRDLSDAAFWAGIEVPLRFFAEDGREVA